jgi:hypothetical protein
MKVMDDDEKARLMLSAVLFLASDDDKDLSE